MNKIDDLKTGNLEDIARAVRSTVIEMSHRAKASHLASSLSCIDILVAALWGVMNIDPDDPKSPDRDRLILSKGHAAQALYASLAHRGFFETSLLSQYNRDGGPMSEHPGPNCMPGVEAATGSLGHGLPIGLGMAIAGRIQKRDYRVFVVLGDGECNEGSVWEAALLAAANNVSRLCVIVDFNQWQGTGRSTEIMSIQPLKEKWEAFGWNAANVDGHDISNLVRGMNDTPNKNGQPVALIAHTVKGKGVSFMEDDNNWHYRIPTKEEVAAANRELGIE